jgi:hypothetical protein
LSETEGGAGDAPPFALDIVRPTEHHQIKEEEVVRTRRQCALTGALALLLINTGPAQTTNWLSTGALNTARYAHTATLLPNGKVLVAAGYNGSFLANAELYNPAGGTWTNAGSLSVAAYTRTATLLTNGQVLIAGGVRGPGLATATVELYNPVTGTWTNTGALNTARSSHTATLLPDGKVLVAGGADGTNDLSSAELYAPGSGTWTLTGPLNNARDRHTATPLPNGKVLVVGGVNGFSNGFFNAMATAELYDPVSGVWTNASSLTTKRFWHTATLLSNGKVLVAGGDDGHRSLSGTELYDGASGTWTNADSMNNAREEHTATLLPNGKVLVAGGWVSTAELYDPVSATWTVTGSMKTSRMAHTATLLPTGKVLVAAGYGSAQYLVSAELYDWGADSDDDGDGFTNLQEYLAGTDPTNASSAFRILGVVATNDDVLVTWQTAGGRTNVVQSASDMAGSYSNVSPNIILPGSDDVTTNWTDTGGATNSASRFYKIRLVP